MPKPLRLSEYDGLYDLIVDKNHLLRKIKVFGSMSKRAADMLRGYMETLGPVSDKDVMEAQDKFISVICRLEDGGEIYIVRAGDDEMVV